MRDDYEQRPNKRRLATVSQREAEALLEAGVILDGHDEPLKRELETAKERDLRQALGVDDQTSIETIKRRLNAAGYALTETGQ